MTKFSVLLGVLLVGFGAFGSTQPYVESHVRQFVTGSNFKSQKTLPVLLVFKGNSKGVELASFRQRYSWAKSLTLKPLWIINGAFASLSREQIKDLGNSDEVKGIYWSRKPIRLKTPQVSSVNFALDYTYGLKKLGVPEVRKQYPNLTGTGVRVGVLDTGLSVSHPDLKGRLKLFRNFSPDTDNSPKDGFGHGTHVSGTIAGGSSSGLAIGVAPEADLIVARIFDANGNSDREQILNAMQWVADPDGDPKTADFAQVVNNSWSDDEPFSDRDPQDEPFCAVIDAWVKLGIIPVFSAGNSGPSEGSINIPGGCPNAFSVGATEQNDRSPHFSSTGPAVWKSVKLMKPEVSAPGFHIVSADKYGGYEDMSGTSMSAPHVTGAFAILLQAYPNASPEQIKAAMTSGALDLGDSGQDGVFGWGRIDIIKSLEKLREM